MTTYFIHTSTLDDDCHFPVTATWTVHYTAYPAFDVVIVGITKVELESVTVELMPGEPCQVIAQTANKMMSDFGAELRKRLDMDQLYEEAFEHYQRFPDAGRDVA
jgi:hypothetical protein